MTFNLDSNPTTWTQQPVYGPPAPTNLSPTVNPSPLPGVSLPVYNTSVSSSTTPGANNLTTQTATDTSGGGGGGGGGAGSGDAGAAPSVDAEREAMMREIESVYNPQMAFLGQAENQLRGDLPSALAEAESQYKTNQSLLSNKKSQAQREIGNQETAAGTRKEDAMTAARRLFNELQMGGRQRFGGASSAGEAFSELSQRELMRNQGGINTNYQTALQQLGQQKVKVDEDYQSGLLQLEQQKQSAVNQVNRDFQNKLLEINRMRAEAESAKAEMRLAALQELRNQVFAIQLQNQQFQQQLQLQRTQGLASVDSAAQAFANQMNQAAGTTSGFAQTASTNPQTALSVTPGRTSTTSVVPQTGTVTPRRQEDLYAMPVGMTSPGTYTNQPYSSYSPDERLFLNTFGDQFAR